MPDLARMPAAALLLAICAGTMAAPAGVSVIDMYADQGVVSVDIDRGRRLWTGRTGDRGCGDCHGRDPGVPGRHVKTGKAIEAMAPSVNPARYGDADKIEKWFKRNCRWTFGRVCSAQEKADMLAWLMQL